jgi:KUP system potassium uptake protein
MALWRQKLFILLSRNAANATDFFRLPANRVLEIGIQVEL